MIDEISFAKKLFYEKQYQEAFEIFINHKEYYYAGLCALMFQDKNLAKSCWEKTKKDNPASQFGLCVLDYIELKTPKLPTYFQTRAFLEIFINLFLENDLMEWCENLIACNQELCKSNPESYKFIARALFSNGYFDLAITFCKKSLDCFYADPEAMLIIAQCYYLINKKEIAKLYIDKLMNIVRDYYPAKLFNRILEKDLK